MENIYYMFVDTLTSVFAAACLLRFWSQVIRLRPPEQFVLFIFKATNWFILPVRRIVSQIGGYDWASLLGIVFSAVVSVFATTYFNEHFSYRLLALASIMQFFTWVIYGFILLLVVEALMSWFSPESPLVPFISALNAPLLRPFRKFLPPLGGIDLSPVLLIFLLQLVLKSVRELLLSLL